MINSEWSEVELIDFLSETTTGLLGFGLLGNKTTGVLVRNIVPGGIADLNGHLRPGDLIIKVGDVCARGMGPDQVSRLLRQSMVTNLSCATSGVEDTSQDSTTTSSYQHLNTTMNSNSTATSSTTTVSSKGLTIASTITFGAVLPVRLIVSRRAVGSPSELSSIYNHQNQLIQDAQPLGPICIVPTEALDEPLDYLIRLMSPAVDAEAASRKDFESNLWRAGDGGSCYTKKRRSSLVGVYNRSRQTSMQKKQRGLSLPREKCTTVNSQQVHNSTSSSYIQPPFLLPDDGEGDDENKQKENGITSPTLAIEDVSTSPPKKSSLPIKTALSELPSENFEFSVVLKKPPGHLATGLGITIIGYVYGEHGHPVSEKAVTGVFVKEVLPNGLASNYRQIKVHDQIVKVNGISLKTLTNKEAAALLKSAGPVVHLTFIRHTNGGLFDQLKQIASKHSTDFKKRDYSSLPKLDSRKLQLNRKRMGNKFEYLFDMSNSCNAFAIEIPSEQQPPMTVCSAQSELIFGPLLDSENDDDDISLENLSDNGRFVMAQSMPMLCNSGRIKCRQKSISDSSFVCEYNEDGNIFEITSTQSVLVSDQTNTTTSAFKSSFIENENSSIDESKYWRFALSSLKEFAAVLHFAGRVTPEFSQLMVDVWLPIIGEDKEIKVFRVVRPKNVRCLGISIEGFMVEQQDPQPSTSTSYLQEQEEHRHFVQHIIANSLFGSLNCLQPGDEILQVNGYRLHGQSHLEAVRCLRCLPSHIEIVIARSSDGIAGSIGDADYEEGTLRIAASEIGSMRTGYDYDCMLDYRSRSGSLDTRLAGTQPTNLKVTEWVRQSRLGVETDMSIDPREIDDGNSTSLSLCPSPSTSVGFSSFPQDKMSSLRLRNYPFPSVPDLNSSLTSSCRNQKPTWGSVPLILMLRRDNPGFGFSFSEFEVLDVSESSPSKRRTSTLGRRRTISSDISTYPSGSSTLPRFSSSRRGTLSRSSNPSIPPRRGVLLIDRITPGGCVEKDGRLAVGDRLLFVNDRKLSRASVQEAAVVLQTVPIGYTMIGVAKMKLVNSELPRATLSSPQMTPLEDEKEYKTSTSPVFTTSMQDEYANDHPLDYYSRLVTSVENAHLHAHDISSSTPVQEMDRNEETVIRVKTESLPLGLKLDASALAGVDGCRVIQVVRGGAIERSASLMPGDYITRINSESLRNVSNTEAFRILRKISLDCPNIEIAYYPADKIASHRAKFINAPEKLNDQPMESSISLANGETVVGSVEDVYHLLTTTSLELSSEVLQSGPWMQTREVKLLKLPGEQTWGFRITGPECWESEEKDLPLPPEVALPVFISEVIPNTAAERGQLLQPGDIIVGMNGMDASSVGCRRVAEWMQHSIVMSATSPKCANSDVDSDNPVNNEWSFLYLLILPLNPAEEEPFEASHYDPLIRGGNRHSVDLQTIPSVKLSSPDTSIETKILNHDSGPTSFMGTNDNLIRSEFVSSNDSSMLEEEPSSVATLDHAYDLSIPQPLAFTGLTINPPDASHSASETEPETVSVDRPPSSAATRSRVAVAKSSVSPPLASSQVHVIPNIQSVESQSAWRNIGSQLSASLPSLTKSYRRIDVPRDEVHVAAMLIKGADASSTPQNSHQSVGECETLGIRLVGHRDTNKRGVFICSIRNDSIADRTPGLHVTDEILQINNICVLGLTHVSAKLMISKETEMVRRVLIGSQVTSNGDHQRFGKLYIVIRHNVAYNASVMAKPANLDSAQFLPRGVNSTSVVDIMDMSPSPLMSSSPTNGPLHGISRSPSQRPTTKNVDIVNVLIERNKSGFGLCLVNMNPKRELGVFVQNIDPSSPAGRSNLIKCWDRIIAVNGQEIDDYDSTLQILTHCKLRADLRLVRVKEGHSLDAINEVDSSVPQSFSPQKFPTPLARGVETVLELIKGQGDLGISIVGGSDSSLGGVFVQEIFEKGFASKDGRLESGDRLLAVNEFDLRNATHAAATQALRSTGQRVLLTVIRDIPSKHSSARFQQIFSIPLQRKPGQQFGLILDDCKTASGVIIANIVTGSAASRNTVLQPGDFILEVDGLDVRKASSDEVSDLLKQCSNYVLLKAGRPSSSQPPPQLRLFTTLLTRDRQSSTPCLSSVSIAKISHSPVANIFGMVLREATEMELLCAPGHLIIDAILPDSGAARCGMLQVGDRVLSLDREPVDWLTFEELEAFTRHFDSLLFEFGRLPPPASALAALNSSKRIFRDQTFGIMTSTPCESGLGTLKEDVMVMPECPQPVQQDVEQPPTHFQTNCIDGMLTKQPQAIDEEQEDPGAQIQVLRISLPFVKPPPSGISDWLHCDPTKIPIPQLGLRIVAAPGSCGQRVVGIQPGSPGQISGLLLDDQILGLDDHLLVAFGGQNSEKTLLAIKEAWLLRVQDGEFISPVSLTVIRSASKPNKQTSFEPRRSIDNGFVSHLPSQHNSTNLSAIGFTPIVASQFPVRLANHQRKYPKDVGDNIDVNLQAAPPGLLAGLGAGAILGASAAGAWRGAIDDYSGQPFHLPGEREIVAPPNVDGYTMLGQEPEDSNDHDPNLSNDENHEYYEQNSSDPMGIENIPPPAICDDYQQQQQQHEFATEATVDYQENQINYDESEQQQQVEDQ